MSGREKRAAAINAAAITSAEIANRNNEEDDDDSDYDPSKDDKEGSKRERDETAFTWATNAAPASSSSASASNHSLLAPGAREWREDDPVYDEFDRQAKLERQLMELSHKRARLAGEHWATMVDADREHVVAKRSKAMVPFTDGSFDITVNINKKNKGKKDGKHSKKSQLKDMMSMIYGTAIGASSLSSTNAILQSSSSSRIVTDADVRSQIVDSVKNIQRKEKVMEMRKFAGQQIQIERTLKVGEVGNKGHSSSSSNAESSSSSSNAKGGVDTVLDIMKGPKVVSTVAKSSLDWDNYKEEQGLEDDLAVAAKDGYLTRKEFLERVDYRKFEQEREERLKRMAAAQMAAGGAAGPSI